MSFPRYPKYKDSGVEWLGEVPDHWEVLRLKNSFRIVGGSTPKSETESFWDGNILWATPSDLSKRESIYINDTQRKITADGLASCGTTLVPAASIILSTRAPIGSLAIAETVMCTNQGCKSLVPSERAHTEYFAHLLSISSEELNIRGKGTTFLELSGDELGAFRTPVPPLLEQTRIAVFLDRETAKIDGLVAEQRRLIELLKEKRQAVISHAVTKGLNPHAPMKPSGIEWLGDVPVHWAVTRLCYYARIENGTTPSRDNPEYWFGGDIPWLSSGEVNQYRITEAGEFVTKLALEECSLRMLPKGTIVIGMIGQGKTRGLSAVLEIEACINQNLAAIVLGANLQPDYVLYIFQSVYEYLREFGRGGNQAALNCEILSALRVPLPPPEEQARIADYVGQRLKEFDALTTEAQRAIDLLQERRTALISAAVTGKIDVRGLAETEAA